MSFKHTEVSRTYVRGLLALLLFFVASRLFFVIIGVRFDTSTLTWFYQILDPRDLKENFSQSLFYLHTQPPGFNFLIGVILNLCPGHEAIAFSLIYSLMGMGMAAVLYTFLVRYKVNYLLALGVSVFFMVSPAVVLMENWLFYSYPAAFLLTLSSFLLLKYCEKRRWYYGLIFFLILSLIVLTRSLFHLLWYVLIFIWMIVSDRARIRQILLCGAFPLLVIFSVYLKNYLVFGQFNLSSWTGANLIKMTFDIPQDRIIEHIDQGRVSDLVLLLPFQGLAAYEKYIERDTTTGIPVLDEPFKSTGSVNFNHLAYISLSGKYRKGAEYLIRKYPWHYCLSVLKAFYGYLKPCSDSIVLAGHNRRRLGSWVALYEKWIDGTILEKVWSRAHVNRRGEKRMIHFNFLYFLIPLVYGWGILLSFRGTRLLRFTPDETRLVRYMMFNVVYAMAVGNFLEFGENMRFRFLVLPFIFIIGTMLLVYLWQKTRFHFGHLRRSRNSL